MTTIIGGKLMEVDKSALRSFVRHTDTHNRIKEMDDMWKQHEKEKYSDQERDRESKRRHRSGRSSKSRLYSDTIDENRTSKSSKAGPWTKKLMEYEEGDADRWGHSGYKELYPEDFDESGEPAVTIEKEEAVAEEKETLKDEDIVERWKKGRFRPQVDSRRPTRGFDRTRLRFGWGRGKFSGPSQRNMPDTRPQEGRVDRTHRERQRSRSQENYRGRLPGRFDRRRSRSDSREHQRLKGREQKIEKAAVDSRDAQQSKISQRDRSGEGQDDSEMLNVESKGSGSLDTSLKYQDRRAEERKSGAPRGRWDQTRRSKEEEKEVVKDVPDVKTRKGSTKVPDELMQVESVAKEIRGRWERDESSDEEEAGKDEFVEIGKVDMFGRDISKRYDYKLRQRQVGSRDKAFTSSRERLANDRRSNEMKQKDEGRLESKKSVADDTMGQLEDRSAEEEAMEKDESWRDHDSSGVDNKASRRTNEKKKKHRSKEKKKKAKRSKSSERGNRSDELGQNENVAEDLLMEKSKDESKQFDVSFDYSRERNAQSKAVPTKDLDVESEMRERIKLKMKQRMEGALLKKNILSYGGGSDETNSDQEGLGKKSVENSHMTKKWQDSDDNKGTIRVEDGAGFGKSEKQIAETVSKRERRGRKSRKDSSSTLENRKGGKRNRKDEMEGDTGNIFDDTIASQGYRRGRSRGDHHGRTNKKIGKFKNDTRHRSASYSSADDEKEVEDNRKVQSISARDARKALYSSDDDGRAGKRKKTKTRRRSDSEDSVKKEVRNRPHRSRRKSSSSESSSEHIPGSERVTKANYKSKGQSGKGGPLEAKTSRFSIERTGRSEREYLYRAKENKSFDATDKRKEREVHVKGSYPKLSSNSRDDSYSSDDNRNVNDRTRHRGSSVQERESKRRPAQQRFVGRKNNESSSENENDKALRHYKEVKKFDSEESDSSSSEDAKNLPKAEYKRKSKKNREDSSSEDEKREKFNKQKRSDRQRKRSYDNILPTNGKRSDRKKDDGHRRKRGRDSSEDERKGKEKSRKQMKRSSSSPDEYNVKRSEKKQKGRLKGSKRERRKNSVSSSDESEDKKKKEVFEKHAKYEEQVGEKSANRVALDVAGEDEKLEEESRKISSELSIGKSTGFRDTDRPNREETHYREISAGMVEQQELVTSAAGNAQDPSHFEATVAGNETKTAIGNDSSSDFSLYGDIDLKTVASHTDKAKRTKASPHQEVRRVAHTREARSPFDGASRIDDKTERKKDGLKPRHSRESRSLSQDARSKREEHRRRTRSRESRSSDDYSDRGGKRSPKRTARKQSPKSYTQSRKRRSLSRDGSEDGKRWEKSQHRSGGKSHERRHRRRPSSASSASESDGYHERRKRGGGSKKRDAQLRSRSPRHSSSSSYSSSGEEARRKDKSVSRKRNHRNRRSASSDESRSSVSSIDKRKRRRK